jgi:hypothetical protein
MVFMRTCDVGAMLNTTSSSSSSPIEGLGHWPVPASMNSTFCVVYQDLKFVIKTVRLISLKLTSK